MFAACALEIKDILELFLSPKFLVIFPDQAEEKTLVPPKPAVGDGIPMNCSLRVLVAQVTPVRSVGASLPPNPGPRGSSTWVPTDSPRVT